MGPAGAKVQAGGEQERPSLPIRVCAASSQTIGQHHRDLPFTMVGTNAELDRQIAVMRERIAQRTNR